MILCPANNCTVTQVVVLIQYPLQRTHTLAYLNSALCSEPNRKSSSLPIGQLMGEVAAIRSRTSQAQ